MVVLRAGLCPGLTEDMIQLLRANGIRTVVDFVSSDLEDVAQKCSLSYKALVAVRRVLLAQFSAFPANGADLYEELKSSTAILPTGSPSLDQLLDSGLYTGEVTELMGAPGSGKTQVCLGIAASVSLGLKQHVLFLDSTGGFTASRLYQMLQAQTEDEEEQLEALQRIQVVRVFNIYELLSALQELRDRLSQQVVSSTGPLKMVLLDSVSAVIYPLLGGRQSEVSEIHHGCWHSLQSSFCQKGPYIRSEDACSNTSQRVLHSLVAPSTVITGGPLTAVGCRK
ncbi:DNA repair protein RAD51 homolog 4 isoform 2-T5 [Acridotheres tristis]